MKKICIFLLMLSFICSISSGCTAKKQKPNMIQSKRRFEKYIVPQNSQSKTVVDLSEGPKQNYDGYLGPQNLNFEFKIVDPY